MANGFTEAKCPKCKKWIPVKAQKCPFCTTDFSQAEITNRTKEQRQSVFLGCGLMLALCLALAWCVSPSDAPEESASTATVSSTGTTAVIETESDLDGVRAQAEKDYPAIEGLSGVPDAPIRGFCSSKHCEISRVEFRNQNWPNAWKGDYQAQRNVAYCRADGCGGAVEVNLAEACAWRSVIIEVNADDADDTDTRNLNQDCGKLDSAGKSLAIAKAESILERIQR